MLKHCLASLALIAMVACSMALGADDDAKKTQGAALSKDDAKFATMAAQGGMTEVKAGELAAQKATDADVKKYGEEMVKDHGKANTELMALISSKGGTAPAELHKKHQKMLDDLSGKSGADFDKAYVKMMVADHKDTVDAFKKFAERGDDSDLKKWAAQTLPTLEMHYSMIKEIDKRMNGEHKMGDGK